MHQDNIASRVILILTVITLVLAAPVLVQEKRQACVDVVDVPEDMITVLEKRILGEDLDALWDRLWHYENVWGNRNLEAVQPPHSPADSIIFGSTESDDDSYLTHTSLADSNHGSMELDSDAPPPSSEAEDSHWPPSSPEWQSAESEDWSTAPSSLGSSTESDSDPDRWSTISNAPSAESQSENLKAADTEMRGKAKVSRRISGIANGVNTVDAAQMESRSMVDPGPNTSPPW